MLRNEIKYLITYEDYILLSRRMAAYLTLDSHSQTSEGYRITSLYLDDMHNTSYYEKLSGDTKRKKYRLRSYNYDNSFISLECKEKKENKIDKTSIRVDESVYRDILNCNFDSLKGIDAPLAKEVFALNREKGLKPVVAVDYVREAYTHPLSNTRITFDKELSCGIITNDLFSPEYKSAYIFDKNQVILEVKFDKYLPKVIAQLLAVGYRPLAASKYVLCREHLMNNNIIIKNTVLGGQNG